MPISDGADGKTVYGSARDVGNVAAGYVAGRSGLSWAMTRAGCDAYQVMMNYKNHNNHKQNRLVREGKSSTSAQFLGWQKSGRSEMFKGLPNPY